MINIKHHLEEAHISCRAILFDFLEGSLAHCSILSSHVAVSFPD